MNSVAIFLKLIRWPNLVFMATTQILFYFIIFPYTFHSFAVPATYIYLQPGIFFLLPAASVLIAGGGYIINDVLDTRIDQINKPESVIIGNRVSHQAALSAYFILSITGIGLSAYISYKLQNIFIVSLNILVVLTLLFYSTTLKRTFLIGNVAISLLTAWVILILPVAEYHTAVQHKDVWLLLLRYGLVYGGFAFITSMIREVIKDMEDIRGDSASGCTTIPVVWGIDASKIYTGIWVLILNIVTGLLIIHLMQAGNRAIALYGFFLIISPSLFISKKLYSARTSADFHILSAMLKWTMLAGTLSMLFFISVNKP